MSLAPPESTPPRLTKLCPHCLAENDDSAHMCRACLTPMTFIAATVPVMSIWSVCDTYRKASRSPAKFIVVLGMWLICGATGFTFAAAALDSFATGTRATYRGGNPFACLLILPSAAAVWLFATLLIRTTSNYFHPLPPPPPPTTPTPPPTPADEELTRAALEAAPENLEPGDVLQD